MPSNESTTDGQGAGNDGVHGDLIEQLQAAIESTFESIVLPFEGVEVHEAEEGEDNVTVRATISFDGDVEGHVLIHCTLSGAHDISRGMLMLEEGDPLELEDVQEAMGECANLVAGVLKRNAFDKTGEVRMSCPTVEVDADTDKEFPDPDAQLAYKLIRGVSAAEVWVRQPS